MKKMLASILVIAGMGIGIGLSMAENNSNESSSLIMANLEALTSGESSSGVQCYCKTNWFSSNVCSANASGAYCGGDPCQSHDGNYR